MKPQPHKPKVLCLTGPTACGKTALALQLAARYPLRLISVDSAQVYRGMDIGTGKPDTATLRRFPHRLINIRDPAETYSAAEFRRDAQVEVQQAWAEGCLPLLVGGTMLYFKALRDGLTTMPQADNKVRERIAALAAASGWEAVHKRLRQVDPPSAARIHPNDPQRLQRALEIYMLSGRPMSQFHAEAPESNDNKRDSKGSNESSNGESPPFHLMFHIIHPLDRAALHQRIAARFRAMLAYGLVDEVRALYARDDLHPALPALKSVGYRQVWQYLEGRIDHAEMVQRGIAATRQLAKRQLTWLRNWPGVAVPSPPAEPPAPALSAAIEGLLRR